MAGLLIAGAAYATAGAATVLIEGAYWVFTDWYDTAGAAS